jgi:hypothetical protein
MHLPKAELFDHSCAGSGGAASLQPQHAVPCLKSQEIDMGHTIGDGIIVVALAAALVAYLYFKHAERHHRLQLVHQERQFAMEKGLPLPAFPR